MTLLGSELPLVQAPMAGGPGTVELGRAVAEAGAFPFAAAGYKRASVFAEELARWRALGCAFGVNLFVPHGFEPVDEGEFRAYAAALAPEAAALGVELDPVPRLEDDDWEAKLALLLEHPVAAISFTFGLPLEAEVRALAASGASLLATVTTVGEARQAAALGVDGLVLQGPAAGGHSATFDPRREILDVDLPELLGEVVAAVNLPVIAGGGVDGPEAVRRLLEAGADAVAVGTLLLRTDEAGTGATHRDALADPRFERRVITRAFTGRPAGGLLNGFIERHEAQAPLGYPQLHHLTRPLRQAAAAASDPERLHLWAGSGYRSAAGGPAGDVIRSLAA